jgi:Na+/H+ antiporter NhaD/arsenite permease-like protein
MEEFDLSVTTNIKKESIIYLLIIVLTGAACYHLLQHIQQAIAVTVFIALVIGTLMFWKFRVAIAFIGIVILLLTKTINLDHAVEFMNLDVILFLMGMMIIVGMLRRSSFFRWLLAQGLHYAKFEPYRLFVVVVASAAFMAALVDEITSILFIVALTLDFCNFFKLKPVKMILIVVFATNIGSSWTVLGNPIGILIALRSGLTFEDFLQTPFPIGIISLAVILVLGLIWMRQDLKDFKDQIELYSPKVKERFLKDLATLPDKKLFLGSSAIFVSVILLLALHHRLELAFDLDPNTLLIGVSLLGSGIIMLWKRNEARTFLMEDVDWWTLIFFMFLFAKAGALKYVGLTDLVGESILSITGSQNMPLLIALILWMVGFASAAADNVVVVATFIPVLQYLNQHLESNTLWWALLLGGCYGGNLTMVGSTANIIALGVLEERENYHMHLKFWIKFGFFGAIVPMIIGTLGLIIFG